MYGERLTDRSREASELSKFRLVRMLPSEQKLRDYEFTHLDVQRAASQRSKLDMQYKVMLFNALNLIFLNVTMLNCTKKIFTQISLAGVY